MSSRSISPHGGESCARLSTARDVPHVDLERQERVAELLLQRLSAGRRGGPCRSRSSRRRRTSRRGLAESGRCAGDQDRLHHRSFAFELAPRLYEVFGLDAKRLRDGEQDRARELRESAARPRAAPAQPRCAAARRSQFRSGRGTAAPDARRRALPQARRGQAPPDRLAFARGKAYIQLRAWKRKQNWPRS